MSPGRVLPFAHPPKKKPAILKPPKRTGGLTIRVTVERPKDAPA